MYEKSYYALLSIIVGLLLTQTLLAVDSYVEQFGVTKGKPVKEGFVFLDGRYLEVPYVVKREGLTLYVNDMMIEPSDLLITKKAMSKEADYDLWTETNKKRLLSKIEHIRGKYENNLQKDYCYFFFTEGGDISMEPYNVAYELPKIVEDLRSGKSMEEKLKRIRRMNWQLQLGNQKVKEFTTNFSATNDLETRLNELAEDLLRVGDFGIAAGKSIEKGFVFFNGRYVDAPYVVTRKGLGIFINDVLISRPTEWPWPTLEQKDDPKLPEWITRNSIFEDIRDHLLKKNRYLISHYSEKEATRKYVEYLQNLPCVKDLEFTTERSIEVATFSGETWPIDLSDSFSRRTQQVKHDKNSVLQRREAVRKHYEDGLLRGNCFIIEDGVEVRLGGSRAIEVLPNIVKVLRSSRSTEQKFEEFRKLGMPYIDDSVSSLVTDFHASQQLEKRMTALTESQEAE